MVWVKSVIFCIAFLSSIHASELSQDEVNYFNIMDLNNDGYVSSDLNIVSGDVSLESGGSVSASLVDGASLLAGGDVSASTGGDIMLLSGGETGVMSDRVSMMSSGAMSVHLVTVYHWNL